MSRTKLYGWICCALCNVKSVLLIHASWIAYPPIIVYDLLILQWLSLTICHTTIIIFFCMFISCISNSPSSFASSAVLSIENRRKLAVHCGHSGGSVFSSDLTLSERWCDESCKMFVVLRPEVIKLLASLLQRSRIGSPVPEDCVICHSFLWTASSCRSCACGFRAGFSQELAGIYDQDPLHCQLDVACSYAKLVAHFERKSEDLVKFQEWFCHFAARKRTKHPLAAELQSDNTSSTHQKDNDYSKTY